MHLEPRALLTSLGTPLLIALCHNVAVDIIALLSLVIN